MSITFAIEACTVAEHAALASEQAPSLNVHNTGGYRLLAALGLDPDDGGSIDPAELVERIDDHLRAPGSAHPAAGYVTDRLPALRDIALAAARLHRQVMWS